MIDPELAAFVDAMPVFDLGDAEAARAGFEAMLVSMARELPEAEALEIDDRMIPGWPGEPDVKVRVYRPKAVAGPTVPGLLMIHGGGFIVGSIETEHIGATVTAADLGAVVVSVDYRLSPEHHYPAAVHDCYAALTLPPRRSRRAGRRHQPGGRHGCERRRRSRGGHRAARP